MNGRIVEFGAAVSLLAVCCIARADIVELPLDCAGVYDSNTPAWILDFDLGVTFTNISHVYVDWSGESIAALAAEYSNPDDPFPIDVGICSYLGSAPNWRHTDFWAGAATYPAPQLFDARSEFLYGSMPWSELFDGQGRITIDYTQAILGDGWYIEDGSVDLASATLVVDGAIVPEPTTLLLLAIGAVWVHATMSQKDHNAEARGG